MFVFSCTLYPIILSLDYDVLIDESELLVHRQMFIVLAGECTNAYKVMYLGWH